MNRVELDREIAAARVRVAKTARDVPALEPYVIEPAQDVPDGKMPRGASTFVKALLGAGWRVRSTYAMALVPGVRRKGADGTFRYVTETVESVAVRGLRVDSGVYAYAVWWNGSSEGGGVRDTDGQRLLQIKQLIEYVRETPF